MVSGLTDAVEISASLGYHSCARRLGGTVICWGFGTYGQLGNGSILSASTPVTVTGIP